MPVRPARASRDISRPSTSPTWPIVSSATSRANPGRSAAFAADRPGPHRSPSPGRRPAQRGRPPGQPVLQPRRLAVVGDLLARRLPDVDEPPAGHDASPGSSRRHAHPEARAHPVPFRRQPGRDRQPLQECSAIPECVPGRLRKRRPQLPSRTLRQRHHLGERCPHCPPSPRIACPQLLGPLHQPEQPSLPITVSCYSACPTLHAL